MPEVARGEDGAEVRADGGDKGSGAYPGGLVPGENATLWRLLWAWASGHQASAPTCGWSECLGWAQCTARGTGGVQLLGRGRSIPRSWLRCRAGTLDPAEQSPGLGPHLHPARSGQAGFSDLASE